MVTALTIAVATVLTLATVFYCGRRLSKGMKRARAERIIDFLQHTKDDNLRLAALKELGQLDVDIALARLTEALQDSSPAIREAALRIFVAAGRDAVLKLEEIRTAAQVTVNSLGYYLELIRQSNLFRRKIDNYVVPGLIAVLNEADGDVREAALAALRELGTPVALAAIEQTTAARMPGPTQVSAYFPRELSPTRWEPLVAYVYRRAAKHEVATDVGRCLPRLRKQMQTATAQAICSVPQGAMLTATPYLDGFRVNPPQITLGFHKNWHRFEFEIQAHTDMLGKATNGTLTFTVEGIIIADIPICIRVKPEVAELEACEETRGIYQNVFCSYSHDDEEIVRRVETAGRTLGIQYLRDAYSLRSGEDWNTQLLKLIDQADVFQLFWSDAASTSKYVEMEWRHALTQERTNNFIRPVYWSKPMPSPPLELRHVHFCYEPGLNASEKVSHV